MAVRSVVFDIIGRDRASSSFKKIGFAAESAAAKIETAANRSIVAGRKLTKGLTLPVAAAAAFAVDQAIKYQKSLTLLQTAGGELDKNMAVVSAGMKRVAVQTGRSLSDLSEGMYIVEKAGIRGAGGIKVLHAAAEGATAENVDMGTATTALTSILMSYGLHAKDAVRVQNELVAGAGMAKATMQDYAGSLATVVPLAAKAGISFSQVAGAIATLTQHGTSPAESTQELAFAIRNLLAPNNVAIKAMNSLNIDVVDLQKNLGKRGLTGTLQLVEDALAKQSKGGLIAVNTFKQAQYATKDLQIELKHMPPGLRRISEQFDQGKLGYKDYYTAVKTLGGGLFQLGKGFISTESQAKGFNNLLTSGQPAQRTAAATLKQVMGGAVGLNTALQLGGDSAGYFAAATARVNKEGQKNGKNISTWAKTVHTASVQGEILREKLQVMAVNLGEKLLPLVVKAVRFFGNLIDKFTSLPKGVQATILKFIVLAALIGPLLVLVGKLTRAILWLWAAGLASSQFIAGIRAAEISMVGMQGTAYATGLKVRAAFIGMGTAARIATVAVAGLAIGYLGGKLVQGASNGTKALGILGSTAAGAAVGFSMGGPWGAAIGGTIAGVTSLVTAFSGTGDAASKASQVAQAALQAEEAAALQLYGVLKQVHGAYNKTAKDTLLDQLNKDHLLTALRGQGANLPDLISMSLGSSASAKALAARAALFKRLTHDQAAELDQVWHAASIAEQKWEAYRLAEGKTVVPTKLLAGGLKNVSKEFVGVRAGLQTTSLAHNDFTAFAIRNTQVLRENIAQLKQQYLAQVRSGVGALTAKNNYDQQVATLRRLALATGANADDVDRLVNRLARLPRDTKVKLKVDIENARQSVFALQNMINQIRQGHVPGVTADTARGQQMIGSLQAAIDNMRGGTIGINVDVSQAYVALANLASAEAAVVGPKYGGIFKALSGTFLGISKIVANAAPVVSHSDPSTIGDPYGGGGGDYTGGGGGGGSGPGAKKLKPPKFDTSTLRAFGHSWTQTATEVRQAYHSILASIRQAKKTIPHGLSDALDKEEKALEGKVNRLNKLEAQLGTRPVKEDAYSKLADARAKYTDSLAAVKQAVLGSFDITTAGANEQIFNDRAAKPTTSRSILAALDKQVAAAKKFDTTLRKLKKEGLPQALIEQLALAGPGALAQAQALAKSTPKQIARYKSDYKTLTNVGQDLGKFIAKGSYGAGVKAAQGIVDGLKSKESALRKAIKLLGEHMIHQLKKTLKIHSPSQVMFELGGHTAEGYRRGIEAAYAGIAEAGRGLGHAVQHGSGDNGGHGRSGGKTEHHWHAHGIQDPQGFLVAARRREQMMDV